MKANTKIKTPRDFREMPWGSIFKKAEKEIVFTSIMIILGRNGNTWRELRWEEYVSERIKDGTFSERLRALEKLYFDEVLPYTTSVEQAEKVKPVYENIT